ncbi:putative pre-mRNA splicing factor [Dioszegia hungarica]|uniref:RNA helicase n=1 Tax=Dioszegia hungarica TaxID=4972 RepID=A0AA38HBU3_9TREE|nr:putative pre-mRNA splicing factor [Dioszegia hungarica]KAI9638387.1 putative pre-mRNA splicing factor [Dioszegia hungarica]
MGFDSSNGSSAAKSEEEKQRLKKERLEAWKKQRELEKKGKSATPEPAVLGRNGPSNGQPPIPPRNAPAPAKPQAALQMGAMGKIKLGGNIGGSHLKRTISELDDEDAPERKLIRIEGLPDINPEVQSGEAVEEGLVGEDFADEDAGVGAVKVELKENGMDIDAEMERRTGVKEEKMEVDAVEEEEEEEDELEAYMKSLNKEKSNVDQADAKRAGLAAIDPESEDDEPVKEVKDGDSLEKQEAMLAEAAAKTRKKDLPPPDHSKIDYEPFRKNFYSASAEVLDLTEEEAELMRLEMDGIKIRGIDAPRPVQRWGALGLPMACLDVIQAHKWEKPTAIQAQAIPAIMSGRDVIGIAKTGSGKTIAFLLPLFRHVKDQRPSTGLEGPIAVVVGPTRELALQIYKEAKSFLKAMRLRVACCVGGVSISEDIANMKRGADIVVCTPGRLIDLLTHNNGRITNLRRCTYLVLDEADRMFDMGFEPQIMKIYNQIRPNAQKVLFSATFPKTMEGLARKILTKPLEITVGGRSVVAAEIDQRVEVRDQDTKFTRLLEILGEMSNNCPPGEDFRALIFVDRQEWADDLFRDLLQRGYVCSSLHGGKEQVDREDAIRNFKSGDIPIVVATSVAARGLDVPQLRLVINYDCPNHLEDYVHRAGRTGRAGNTGVCVTFITPEQERYAVDILRALEASNAFVPKELKDMSDGFLAKIKDGRAKAVRSGFAGKGLDRLDKKREEKDKAEKHTYGDTSEALSLSSREGAVIPYKPKETTNQFKPAERDMRNESDYTFTEIHVDIINGPAPDRLFNPALFTVSGNSGKNSLAALPAQTLAAIEKAKAEGRTVDASRLARVVAQLHKSIQEQKTDVSSAAIAEMTRMKPKDPDATDWHAVFPINDYPQKARWKVTNKEQMTLLNEISGASVTMRGVYYPPGEDPKIGNEPKLHLLIESNDESKVRMAVEEIRRTLVEGSVAALQATDRGGPSSGRYNV